MTEQAQKELEEREPGQREQLTEEPRKETVLGVFHRAARPVWWRVRQKDNEGLDHVWPWGGF